MSPALVRCAWPGGKTMIVPDARRQDRDVCSQHWRMAHKPQAKSLGQMIRESRQERP